MWILILTITKIIFEPIIFGTSEMVFEFDFEIKLLLVILIPD